MHSAIEYFFCFLALVFNALDTFDSMNDVVVGKCLCRGCHAADCPGTELSICGYVLGKQRFRKDAGRCHFCELPSSPSSSSSRPNPHPVFQWCGYVSMLLGFFFALVLGVCFWMMIAMVSC